FASLVGAMFIGLVFVFAYQIVYGLTLEIFLSYLFIITICGFLGCLIDSLLGASIQAKYRGIDSLQITEKRWLPNERVVLISGLAMITNDAVNFLSGLTASLISIIFFL
ncbi:MAG: DUF92 domain-containing protein, partial [Acholeplasmataceae bacterium]|nr:DUF92 domain-containing protein [Acholeplasmataceae bacterium]